jgi:hypothetical protein
MRNLQLSALLLIVALTFCQRPAQAQQSSESADKAQTKNSELREKAYATLESLAGQLGTLQSAENRARIGANIAESLWTRDETKARALFQVVQQEIKSRLNVPDTENQKELQTFLVFLKLRSDTLGRIVKYDPELAYSFFKATEVDLDKIPNYLIGEEHNLDVILAHQLAGRSPEISLQLARHALARGLSEDVLYILGRLNRKHKETALVLFKEIIEKLRDAKLKEDWPTRQVVFVMVRSLQPPAIDQSAFRELVGVLVGAASKNGCDGKPGDDQVEFCSWMGMVLADLEKIDSRVARLKQWSPERDPDESMRWTAGRQELSDALEDGTVEEVLAVAEKYPELARELAEPINSQLMAKAREAGDLDQMRKVAEQFKGDPEQREALLEEVNQAQRSRKFSEEQLAAMEEKLNQAKKSEERIWLLTSTAYRAGSTDRKLALKLLNRAEQVVETMNPGKDQAQFQISLAMMYCLENEEHGFAIIESLVPKLNSLVDAAIKLDGFDTSYIREGEWNMSAAGSIGDLLTKLSSGAQFFAWSDFDRSISLAGQFDRAEIRMMAQLKLAQAILAGPHKRILITEY